MMLYHKLYAMEFVPLSLSKRLIRDAKQILRQAQDDNDLWNDFILIQYAAYIKIPACARMTYSLI